jgi:DNA-binding PadR family transcriptional regulator
MIEISNTEAALLGLLAEQPMYPYRIEQEVKYREMRFWTELSMSSIYKLLRKLEKDGLVTCTGEISPGNRLRKLYTISDAGLKALRLKLEKLLSEPEHIRWQVDIGTYNATLLPSRKVKTVLKTYRHTLVNKIKEYEHLLKFLKESNCPSHRLAIATRPVYLLKGEIQWLDAYLDTLEKSP